MGRDGVADALCAEALHEAYKNVILDPFQFFFFFLQVFIAVHIIWFTWSLEKTYHSDGQKDEHLQSSSCPRGVERQSGGCRLWVCWRWATRPTPRISGLSSYPQCYLIPVTQKGAGQECLGNAGLKKSRFLNGD